MKWKLLEKLSNNGHQYRKANNLKVRMPLRKIVLTVDENCESIRDEVWQIVLQELNIKNIEVNGIRYPEQENTITDEELKKEGELRDLVRQIQVERKKMLLKADDLIQLEIPEQYLEYKEFLQKKVNAAEVTKGELKVIKI